eukprot:723532-Ditylum_brightwellii.AAC.1
MQGVTASRQMRLSDESGGKLRSLSDTAEKKTDHAPLSSQPSEESDCPYVSLTETLTEDELDNTKSPATGKITEEARTLSHPHSGRTPYLRVHVDASPQNILHGFTVKSFGTVESLDQDSVIESYFTRKYTAPVGASPEEITRLNYFNAMQRALLLASSGIASREEMDAILDYAKSNGIETDEIVRVFEMCRSENAPSEIMIKSRGTKKCSSRSELSTSKKEDSAL